MLFNSIEFSLFLPIIFLLYWFIFQKNLKTQNAFLLAGSYFFYGWWDWRFLGLVFASSITDFIVGLGLGKHADKTIRKALLSASIFVNLSLLFFFKYYNFFAESFCQAFTLLGHPIELTQLEIILPVGISFYTFQTLSYSIDVYKRKIEPTSDLIAFFAFVSFFPQLVAGPIERASNLLPQFKKQRVFNEEAAVDGLRQIMLGLLKKIVIADNCALYVNEMFKYNTDYPGSALLLGAILFAFQIYGDFSGYSDIATGTAKLFGFSLMQNFAFPYFSRDMNEFWRRWHISLSTWFRDYLYFPLGGSKGSKLLRIRNTFIIFIVIGLWHGADWTFVIWGLINALYMLPIIIWKKNKKKTPVVAEGKFFPSYKEILQISITFFMIVLTLIFFRAESVEHAINYLFVIFSPSLISIPPIIPLDMIIIIVIYFTIEWLQRERKHAFYMNHLNWPTTLRWPAYLTIFYLILRVGIFEKTEFIYFAF